jgi:hypothetical protein
MYMRLPLPADRKPDESATCDAYLLRALDTQAHMAVVVANHNKRLQTQAGVETAHDKQYATQ